MSRGAALAGALLATLSTPMTWPLALAAFLLRGGLLLVILPIVVLPSPVGLGNLLGPALIDVVLRGVSPGLAFAVGLVALAVVVWVVAGGLMAATFEAEAARILVGDGVPVRIETAHRGRVIEPPGPRVAARILAARTLAHLPTGLALTWGSARLVAATYAELTGPAEVTSPIALRVLLGAPDAVVAIVGTWTLGEIVGGLAARRIALDGAAVAPALRRGLAVVARHPLTVLVEFWLPTIGLALILAPSTFAAAAAWGTVRVALRVPDGAFEATLSVVLFVAIWVVGLVVVAVATAWRAAVWSIAHLDLGARDPLAARPAPERRPG